jgi:SNF2 family DNA or RNA helicase
VMTWQVTKLTMQGLGKTIQSIALMLSNPSPDKNTKTTLIIVPVSLLHQWHEEIRTKVDPSAGWTTYLYHGPQRRRDSEFLKGYDVILTTYYLAVLTTSFRFGIISVDFNSQYLGPLALMPFHRIIIDEAHTIKNHKSRSGYNATAIKAEYRWLLTATPIQSKIEELFSYLRFLHAARYSNWAYFRADIVKEFNQIGVRADLY